MFAAVLGVSKKQAFDTAMNLLEGSGVQVSSDVQAVISVAVARGWIKGKGADFEDKIMQETMACQNLHQLAVAKERILALRSRGSASTPPTGDGASGGPSPSTKEEHSAQPASTGHGKRK